MFNAYNFNILICGYYVSVCVCLSYTQFCPQQSVCPGVWWRECCVLASTQSYFISHNSREYIARLWLVVMIIARLPLVAIMAQFLPLIWFCMWKREGEGTGHIIIYHSCWKRGGEGEGGRKEDTLLLPGPRPPFSFRIPSLPIKNRRILKGVRIANMKIYVF